MDDLIDFLKIVGLPVVAIVGVIVLIAHLSLAYQCNNYAEMTGVETRLATLDTCYVKQGGKWMRWDEYMRWVTAKSTTENKEPQP